MNLAQSANQDIGHIAEKVRTGMVRIESRGRGAGAGTVWHAEGLVITNAHVAASRPLHVYGYGGDRYRAHLLASDASLDLAALSVDAKGLTAIDLGSSRGMRTGELVFAMGYPWGVDGGFTAGVLIGVEALWPNSRAPKNEWVMASLHLRPGHSGGPMVDSDGKLIGINTIMRGPDVGVAIPVETVKRFLKSALGSNKQAA